MRSKVPEIAARLASDPSLLLDVSLKVHKTGTTRSGPRSMNAEVSKVQGRISTRVCTALSCCIELVIPAVSCKTGQLDGNRNHHVLRQLTSSSPR